MRTCIIIINIQTLQRLWDEKVVKKRVKVVLAASSQSINQSVRVLYRRNATINLKTQRAVPAIYATHIYMYATLCNAVPYQGTHNTPSSYPESTRTKPQPNPNRIKIKVPSLQEREPAAVCSDSSKTHATRKCKFYPKALVSQSVSDIQPAVSKGENDA